jgi:hypothetical protein
VKLDILLATFHVGDGYARKMQQISKVALGQTVLPPQIL